VDKISLSNIRNKALASLIMGIIIIGVILFLLAWTLNYWQAWIYLAIFSSSSIIITIYFLRHDPKLVERRLKVGPSAEKEKSQKVIQSFSFIFVIILVLISVLDHRFHWSIVPWFLVVVSDVFIISGFVLLFFIYKENTYLSATIEVEKQQKVISTGPYRIIRHPLYLSAILLFIFTPIALGSLWGLCVSFPAIASVIWRLINEEKTLSKNLPGYIEYCQITRYRLIPLIW
jgi:protein-S-isoprenylcysteine O-methyltransferase Ste14